MKVGDVSTAEITDATPAVLASHISLRGCQGPADMAACPLETKAAGGLGSIAEQEVDHKVDVLLGGGRGRFTQTITGGPDAGKTVDPVGRRPRATASSPTPTGSARSRTPTSRCSACSTQGNMSLEWTGPAAATGKGNAPAACTEGQRPANEPSLAAMTQRAIDLLDDDKRKGFFLQVEGASIDKQDHATNACGQIGETVAFDRAIGVALDYQEDHPDTLIVVTADHSHTSQIVGEDASGAGVPTGLLDQPADQGRPDAEPDLRDGGLRRPGRRSGRGAAEPAAHRRGRAGLGQLAPAPSPCLGPTTTPTCSRRWAADPEHQRGERTAPAATGPPSSAAARLPPMIVGFVGSGSMAAAIARGWAGEFEAMLFSDSRLRAGRGRSPRSSGERWPPTGRSPSGPTSSSSPSSRPRSTPSAPELGAARKLVSILAAVPLARLRGGLPRRPKCCG